MRASSIAASRCCCSSWMRALCALSWLLRSAMAACRCSSGDSSGSGSARLSGACMASFLTRWEAARREVPRMPWALDRCDPSPGPLAEDHSWPCSAHSGHTNRAPSRGAASASWGSGMTLSWKTARGAGTRGAWTGFAAAAFRIESAATAVETRVLSSACCRACAAFSRPIASIFFDAARSSAPVGCAATFTRGPPGGSNVTDSFTSTGHPSSLAMLTHRSTSGWRTGLRYVAVLMAITSRCVAAQMVS